MISILTKDIDNKKYEPLKQNATVLAFGDSLTYGTGANENESYPSYLARLSGLTVINAGIPGEVSKQGLNRLDKLLVKHKPKLLILCHGGNDILMRRSHKILKENIRGMINLALQKDIDVLLVGVADFNIFGFSTLELYAELAEELGVMYEDDIISKIVADSSLKSDQIHPNAKGYALMADTFFEILKENSLIKIP